MILVLVYDDVVVDYDDEFDEFVRYDYMALMLLLMISMTLLMMMSMLLMHDIDVA